MSATTEAVLEFQAPNGRSFNIGAAHALSDRYVYFRGTNIGRIRTITLTNHQRYARVEFVLSEIVQVYGWQDALTSWLFEQLLQWEIVTVSRVPIATGPAA